MKGRILPLFSVLILLLFPFTLKAEVVTVDDVTVQVKTMPDSSFQWLFQFTLPSLPAGVNIDYAVLSFGVNIVKPPAGKFLEILAADSSSTAKVARYNALPVTGRLLKNRIGPGVLELDITQLVDLWINGGVPNKGILVVSHRRVTGKALQVGKVSLAPGVQKPVGKIYYTEIK